MLVAARAQFAMSVSSFAQKKADLFDPEKTEEFKKTVGLLELWEQNDAALDDDDLEFRDDVLSKKQDPREQFFKRSNFIVRSKHGVPVVILEDIVIIDSDNQDIIRLNEGEKFVSPATFYITGDIGDTFRLIAPLSKKLFTKDPVLVYMAWQQAFEPTEQEISSFMNTNQLSHLIVSEDASYICYTYLQGQDNQFSLKSFPLQSDDMAVLRGKFNDIQRVKELTLSRQYPFSVDSERPIWNYLLKQKVPLYSKNRKKNINADQGTILKPPVEVVCLDDPSVLVYGSKLLDEKEELLIAGAFVAKEANTANPFRDEPARARKFAETGLTMMSSLMDLYPQYFLPIQKTTYINKPSEPRGKMIMVSRKARHDLSDIPGNISFAEKSHWMTHLLKGAYVLKAYGLVNADIKPGNFVVEQLNDGSSQPRSIDYDSFRPVDSQCTTFTDSYMSPRILFHNTNKYAEMIVPTDANPVPRFREDFPIKKWVEANKEALFIENGYAEEEDLERMNVFFQEDRSFATSHEDAAYSFGALFYEMLTGARFIEQMSPFTTSAFMGIPKEYKIAIFGLLEFNQEDRLTVEEASIILEPDFQFQSVFTNNEVAAWELNGDEIQRSIQQASAEKSMRIQGVLEQLAHAAPPANVHATIQAPHCPLGDLQAGPNGQRVEPDVVLHPKRDAPEHDHGQPAVPPHGQPGMPQRQVGTPAAQGPLGAAVQNAPRMEPDVSPPQTKALQLDSAQQGAVATHGVQPAAAFPQASQNVRAAAPRGILGTIGRALSFAFKAVGYGLGYAATGLVYLVGWRGPLERLHGRATQFWDDYFPENPPVLPRPNFPGVGNIVPLATAGVVDAVHQLAPAIETETGPELTYTNPSSEFKRI